MLSIWTSFKNLLFSQELICFLLPSIAVGFAGSLLIRLDGIGVFYGKPLQNPCLLLVKLWKDLCFEMTL